MKKILTLILLFVIFSSCEKTPELIIPDWLQDIINHNEEVLKSNPDSFIAIRAWKAYIFEKDYYFEDVDIISSAGPSFYKYDGTKCSVTNMDYQKFSEKRKFVKYVWKGPNYFLD